MHKEKDITVLEEVGQLLGPLHDFTDALASEKQPVSDHIGNEMLKDEKTDLSKEMKKILRELLGQQRYTAGMRYVLNISSFVDPRFKGSFIEDGENIVKACTEEFMALASGLENSAQPPEATPNTSSSNFTKEKERSHCGLLQ